MKDIKNNKGVIIGVIAYLIIMLIIFLPGYLRNKREKLYILSGDFIKIKYENGTWSNMKSEDYSMKDFEVYDNDIYKGNFKILYTNKYYLYKDGIPSSYEGQIFAYNGTLKMKLQSITREKSEADNYIISEALKKIGISEYGEFNLFQKSTFDADLDGRLENVYAISNYFVENAPSKVFSIVFVEKQGEISILKEKVIPISEVYNEPSYEIHKIVDIKEDGKYEILVEQSYFSQPTSACVSLYKLYGKKTLIQDLCES